MRLQYCPLEVSILHNGNAVIELTQSHQVLDLTNNKMCCSISKNISGHQIACSVPSTEFEMETYTFLNIKHVKNMSGSDRSQPLFVVIEGTYFLTPIISK